MLYNRNMNTPVSIDSSKARGNFYDLLNSVYTKNKSYIIKKSGIPVAKLVSINDNVVKKDFLDFAGMLTEEEGDKLLNQFKDFNKRLDNAPIMDLTNRRFK